MVKIFGMSVNVLAPLKYLLPYINGDLFEGGELENRVLHSPFCLRYTSLDFYNGAN